MGQDDRTETVTPNDERVEFLAIIGVVAVFREGAPALSQPLTVHRPVTIGRGKDADLVLDDVKASRLHAEFVQAAGGVLVNDLNSRNGVTIDGRRVERRALAPVGATLRVGNTLLRVVADASVFRHGVELGRERLIGGASLDPLRKRIAHAAASALPVLVQGESGVGKELVAEAVHTASGRKGQFVSVNCAALPRELIEAELFGHAKGAFSGAGMARRGLARTADGGTLLLDEIGDMPLEAQAKLLRVLETNFVRPLGEDRDVEIDLRFVAATNVDLLERIERGAFREDLYHRLAAVRLAIPPLRERREDIAMLTQHFLATGDSGASVAAMERLMAWHWPGNVRELRNAVSSAAAEARGAALFGVEHLPEPMRQGPEADRDGELRQRLCSVLGAAEGNVSAAAKTLGMRRAGIYEQLKRFGIDPASFRRR